MQRYDENYKTCEKIVKLSFWILKKGREKILTWKRGEILCYKIWHYRQQGDLQAGKKSFYQQSLKILKRLRQIVKRLPNREEILLAAEVNWKDINELCDIYVGDVSNRKISIYKNSIKRFAQCPKVRF